MALDRAAMERVLARAAELLNLTQSALSHQIKALEEQAGVELFLRKTKPLRLSAAGMRLLRTAEQVLPLIDAAEGWKRHLDNGGKMMVTLAGAMSTAELGLTLAEMIRQDKVHAISCTGANLEEDLFNLVAHDAYERVPHYRTLSIKEEEALLERHMNRVTDTCIPEAEAMRLQTEDYVDAKLANFENVLSTTLTTVQRGRERLSGRPLHDQLRDVDLDETAPSRG